MPCATVVQVLAIIMALANGVRRAVDAGSKDVSEEDLDAALGEIGMLDDELSIAIAKRKEREAGGGG